MNKHGDDENHKTDDKEEDVVKLPSLLPNQSTQETAAALPGALTTAEQKNAKGKPVINVASSNKLNHHNSIENQDSFFGAAAGYSSSSSSDFSNDDDDSFYNSTIIVPPGGTGLADEQQQQVRVNTEGNVDGGILSEDSSEEVD